MNTDPEVELAEYNYNELGQLVKKNLHVDSTNPTNRLQSIDYRYNIRGWLKSINNATLTNDGILNNDTDDAFGEELNYNSDFNAGGVTGAAQWNGNISGIAWKTKGPSIATTNVNMNGYAFEYDKLNRLKNANYGSGANGSNLPGSAGRYNESMTYDGMGNISTLQRKGIQGTIDNLTYHYKHNEMSNQLTSVSDASNDPTGFKDGANSGDDYFYDGNGNLTSDNNKGLSVDYNFLNLPKSVYSPTEGKTIYYTYDATGRKLKKTFDQKDHYYFDGIEYNADTLLFAMTEEGRVRPKTGGFTYDYFLKDHLGNIRVVLSSETPSRNVYPIATMEDGSATLENKYYSNIEATRDVKPINFDSNPDNNKVARLTSTDGRQIGPSITLKVNSGDTLNLQVKSFYRSTQVDYSSQGLGSSILNQLLGALINPMRLGGTTLATARDVLNGQGFSTSSNYTNLLGGMPGSNYNSPSPNTPKAYLVWMLFDSEFNLVTTGNSRGLLQVPGGADQLHTMPQPNIIMDKSGFFCAYVVNESPMNVYFDDLQVTMSANKVLEENSYYPFGMLNAQLSAPGITDPINNYKYNDKELQKELSLEWLDYGARFYDPVIGRFTTIDTYAEKYDALTPYQYGGLSPVMNIDVHGDSLMLFRNGKYLQTIDNGKEEMTGYNQQVEKDKKGNLIFTGGQSFSFNDIDLDEKDLKSGSMTLNFMSQKTIDDIISKSGVDDQNVISRWNYAINESNGASNRGSGKMDYFLDNHVSKGGLNIINGIGYNDHDAGNYLWGFGMGRMGFSSLMAKAAAHLNAWYSGKTTNGEGSTSTNSMVRWFENRTWTGDAATDQKAIQKGLNDSGSYFKYKIRTFKKTIQ